MLAAVEERGLALGVDDRELSPADARLALLEVFQDGGGRRALAQPLEHPRPKPRVGAVLGQHGADIGLGVGAAAADRHRRGRDDGAQHAGSGTSSSDREGHGQPVIS